MISKHYNVTNVKGGKILKISEVSDIRTGIVLVRNRQDIGENNYSYIHLTLRSFGENGNFFKEYCEEVELNKEADSQFLTRKGDIIVRLREPNIAICIGENDENLLISSLFAIIRLKDNVNILPEYLTAVLNSEYVKNQLKVHIGQTTIVTLNTSALREVNIPKKNISQQEKIVELENLFKKDLLLTEKLLKLKKIKNKAEINLLLK